MWKHLQLELYTLHDVSLFSSHSKQSQVCFLCGEMSLCPVVFPLRFFLISFLCYQAIWSIVLLLCCFCDPLDSKHTNKHRVIYANQSRGRIWKLEIKKTLRFQAIYKFSPDSGICKFTWGLPETHTSRCATGWIVLKIVKTCIVFLLIVVGVLPEKHLPAYNSMIITLQHSWCRKIADTVIHSCYSAVVTLRWIQSSGIFSCENPPWECQVWFQRLHHHLHNSLLSWSHLQLVDHLAALAAAAACAHC